MNVLESMWPDVYVTHLPCAKCTTVESFSKRNQRNARDRLVEKFHVSSKHFDVRLTVELSFALGNPDKDQFADIPVRSDREKKELRQVLIYMDSGICDYLAGGATRMSKTVLLIPDFASEVYGFLDRAHIGTSLVANVTLSMLISKLKNCLPVHHLMCEFEGETTEVGLALSLFTGGYRMIVHHLRNDLSYTDVRRLQIPSAAGPAADCALILHYLSNSHVADLKAPYSDGRFSLKMLAALADRNFSVGRLRMWALHGQLADYRSMDVVFGGGLRLSALNLQVGRQGLASLIKTTDFLGMPTIQGLEELRLILTKPTFAERARTWGRWGLGSASKSSQRREAVVSSPIWIAGIPLLRQCKHYEVSYEPDGHLPTIALKLVGICEKFERGEITDIVERFKFTVPRRRVIFPFDARNRITTELSTQSGIFHGANGGVWDVYRFRNAVTGEWLTAYVGRSVPDYAFETVLEIVAGTADPAATSNMD